MSNIPITTGSGSASVATEQIGTVNYQQIKVIGGEPGSTSVMGVNPDRSISVSVIGTVAMSIPAGSITAVSATAPPGSVMTVAALAGSVMAVSGTTVAGSVMSVTNPAGSVTGVRTDSASVITVSQSSSIIAVVTGSVVAITNNSSVITVPQFSSILAVPVGSTIAVLQAPSIVGTYAEDAAHSTGEKGIFVLGVRNDAVASFTSANLEYGPIATDSAGRVTFKPFAAEESRVEGYNSVVSTSVTTLVAAAGTGLRNYITDIQIANTGALTTLITFRSGGGTSVLGYTIAPTGGGSNITLQTPMRTLANETFDFQPTIASSVLFATVKGFKAP